MPKLKEFEELAEDHLAQFQQHQMKGKKATEGESTTQVPSDGTQTESEEGSVLEGNEGPQEVHPQEEEQQLEAGSTQEVSEPETEAEPRESKPEAPTAGESESE